MGKELEFKKDNKKTAIVSLGGRITLNSKNVRSIDLAYLREMLINVYGRNVDFVSLKTKKEEGIEYYKDIRNIDLNEYDEVMIYNSTKNLFGGIFKTEMIETFNKLFDFNGDIWYYLADPKMPCTDYAAFIKSRIKDGCIKIDDTNNTTPFSLDYCNDWTNKVFKRTKIAYSGSNYDKYYDTYMNNITKGGKKEANECNILNPDYEWAYIPLFEYYAVNEDLDTKLKNFDYSEKKYDLIYFGNNRQTERNKIIDSIYDKEVYNNYVLGFEPSWKKCKFDFSGYVTHDEMFEILPKTAYATVVLGDDLHNDNIKTARFFESMLLDICAFIWHSYDPNKRFVNNQELKDFIYISSGDELIEKINKIKNDEAFYKHIVELERQEILNQFLSFKNENKIEFPKKTELTQSVQLF